MKGDQIEFSNIEGTFDRYRFSIESDFDQELHISLFSYSPLHYPYMCSDKILEKESQLYFVTDRNSEYIMASPGGGHLTHLSLGRGERIEVQVLSMYHQFDPLPHNW